MPRQYRIQTEAGERYGLNRGYKDYATAAETCCDITGIRAGLELLIIDRKNQDTIVGRFCAGKELLDARVVKV